MHLVEDEQHTRRQGPRPILPHSHEIRAPGFQRLDVFDELDMVADASARLPPRGDDRFRANDGNLELQCNGDEETHKSLAGARI